MIRAEDPEKSFKRKVTQSCCAPIELTSVATKKRKPYKKQAVYQHKQMMPSVFRMLVSMLANNKIIEIYNNQLDLFLVTKNLIGMMENNYLTIQALRQDVQSLIPKDNKQQTTEELSI